LTVALTRLNSMKRKSISTVAQHADAHPSKPQYQESIWLELPPASQHRAVLLLHKAVPLFCMQACTLQSIVNILQSLREATPTIMVQTIFTDIHRRVEDCHYIELMICFY
jgi:hypothetical protein